VIDQDVLERLLGGSVQSSAGDGVDDIQVRGDE
jgi:hypothetical protein